MITKRVILMIATACAAMSAQAAAPNWVNAINEQDQHWQLDVNSFKVSGAEVRFWTKAFPNAQIQREYPQRAYALMHARAECGGDSLVTDQFVFYKKDGSVELANSDVNTLATAPGTIWATLRDMVCDAMKVPH